MSDAPMTLDGTTDKTSSFELSSDYFEKLDPLGVLRRVRAVFVLVRGRGTGGLGRLAIALGRPSPASQAWREVAEIRSRWHDRRLGCPTARWNSRDHLAGMGGLVRADGEDEVQAAFGQALVECDDLAVAAISDGSLRLKAPGGRLIDQLRRPLHACADRSPWPTRRARTGARRQKRLPCGAGRPEGRRVRTPFGAARDRNSDIDSGKSTPLLSRTAPVPRPHPGLLYCTAGGWLGRCTLAFVELDRGAMASQKLAAKLQCRRPRVF